ncbi:cutinase [Mycobacterium sp. 852002-51971_SCH5477799-a]|uniref:cutinase family protein n=1 Tax=Mycobacterium sp. 852002-51971_SCH5477799-a TaxID=1834106 RepID=UPI0007FD80EF|nr:cutinase family protein [Mycobacterium sp. 852002-51971_SCH5477799-a]OBF63326.1 cutinase [Mycobacterium sp. 852002-51971_SCH5477799-a]
MRLIPFGLGIGVGVTGALLIAPQLVPHASASCPGVEVVFARGTDEPPGVGKVGGAFVSALREQTRKSVGAYAVNYPANKDFLAATNGANDASTHLQQMAVNCPNTKLVLGGYSQGAAVVDIVTAAPISALGYRQPLPPQAADHVAAVALFGNPSGRAGQLMSALSPNFEGKTIDLCNPGDPICSGGTQWSSHLSYVPGLTNRAANFVAGRV